ncbi:MAG: transcription antitermination factor NusB [Verrucomicrobiota bacterium]
MGNRRDGREAALQFLVSRDIATANGRYPDRAAPPEEALPQFWELRTGKGLTRTLAEELIAGVLQHQPSLDEKIESSLENYRLERTGVVDRNLIRLGLYELLHRSQEAPPAVVINEAIEIAKRFGAPESPKFVHGLLDRLRREHAPS